MTCEIGTWSRERTCTNPAPQYNGADCVGGVTESTQCDTGITCPGLYSRSVGDSLTEAFIALHESFKFEINGF